MPSKEIEAKIKEQELALQEQAHELANEEKDTTVEEKVVEAPKALTPEERDDQADKLKTLLRGVNDKYKHHFNFEELDMKFDVTIKVPNALEEAPITNFVFSQFPDLDAIPNYQYVVYYTIKLLENQGENLPEFLQDMDNIYNTDILYAIGEGYFEWRSRFQF